MTATVITQMPVQLNPGQLEIKCRINAPGIVRAMSYAYVERPVVSFLAAKQGKTEVDEVPVLFIELDPEGEKVERTFVLLPTDTPFRAKDGKLARWLATGVNPKSGQVLHLFEIVEAQ